MKANSLISVVIPVYNVENYLDRCVESVVKQTYDNLEIILVDDGSTDDSGKKCDAWSKKDKRIKVYHKKNGGLSDARNYGIAKSRGDCIMFVDSDDDLESFGIEYLYKLLSENEALMSVAPHLVVTETKKVKFGGEYPDEVLIQKEALARMLQEKGFTVSAWSKLYKKKLFDGVKFPKGKIYEDNGTTYKLIMKCDKIAYGNKAFYNYYLRDGSITKGEFAWQKMDYIYLADEMCEEVLKKYPELKIPAENKRLDVRFSVLAQMPRSGLSRAEMAKRKEILMFLKARRWEVLKNNQINKRTRLAMLSLMLGERFYDIAWQYYQRKKV